jgi:hypothetical protein
MGKDRANIDLLFRNGLRDYEVLPPAEVWDNIHPTVSKRSSNVFLKAAAFALICSLTFLAYFLTSTGPVRNDLVSDFYISLDDPVRVPINIEDSVRVPISTYSPSPLMPVLTPEIILYNEEIMLPEQGIMFSEGSDDLLFVVNDLTIPAIRGTQTSPDYSINKENELNISFPDFGQNDNSGYLSPFNSYSQNRWTLSAMASPTYFSNFGAENSDAENKMSFSEHAVVSYSGGLNFSYRINKRFSIQTGLYYASLDRRVDGIYSYSGFAGHNDAKGDHTFEVMTTSGPLYSQNSDVYLMETEQGNRIVKGYASSIVDPEKANLSYITSSITQNFSYLQMPLVVRYKFIDKVVDFNIMGGVSYDFLVENTAYASAGNTKYEVGKTMGLNTLTFSSSLGMGMEYNFSDKISLNLEPTFRYYVNPFNQPGRLNIHPYSFGIFSGFSYKF